MKLRERGPSTGCTLIIPAVKRDVWLRVGMALQATGWRNALEIWDEWSRTCPESTTKRINKRHRTAFAVRAKEHRSASARFIIWHEGPAGRGMG